MQTETPHSNFLRGAKWSPDGACLLTTADDNWLRVYDTPPEAFALPAAGAPAAAGSSEAQEEGPGAAPGAAAARVAAEAGAADSYWPALRVQAGELVYDYAWFRQARERRGREWSRLNLLGVGSMSAADPGTCAFAVASRGHPVHLWDAGTGQLRCSYRPYNAVDEPTPAHSLAFSADGGQLACGLSGEIHLFEVSRPGRDCCTIKTWTLAFSACGSYLYTGARRDPLIHCWDVRNATGARGRITRGRGAAAAGRAPSRGPRSRVVYSVRRQSGTTNQRIGFSVEPCGRHLATGRLRGEDGRVRVFDLRCGSEVAAFAAAADTVSGCDFHPLLPLLATASGHRRFPLAPADSSSGSGSDSDSSSGSSSCNSSGEEDERPDGAAGAPAPAGGSRAAAAARRGAAAKALAPGTDENALRVWRFQADVLQLAAAAGDEGAAGAGAEAGGAAAEQSGQAQSGAAAGQEPQQGASMEVEGGPA
eukprot:scaffold9.g3250.t1